MLTLPPSLPPSLPPLYLNKQAVYAALALEPQLLVRCGGEYMQGWEDQAWAFFRVSEEGGREGEREGE